jgi:hypothetical protein
VIAKSNTTKNIHLASGFDQTKTNMRGNSVVMSYLMNECHSQSNQTTHHHACIAVTIAMTPTDFMQTSQRKKNNSDNPRSLLSACLYIKCAMHFESTNEWTLKNGTPI